MTFFYDLNKKLAGIGAAPAAQQLNESKPDFLDLDRDGDKKEPMKKAAKQKPDYKSKMQDKFGGSASDLTKGLTTKSKKVNEGAHSVRDVLAYEIKMILDGAAAGDDQTDHIVDELGDIFNDIKASRDKTAMMAYEMMVDTIDEDATTQAVAARKALALLKNNSANMAEGNYTKDAMELNPDFARVGKKPGVMGKLAQGVKKVADFVAPGDEDLLRDLERKTGGRRPAKVAEETGLNKSVEAASKIINKTDPYSTHVGSSGNNHVFFSGSSGSDEHTYHIYNDKTKDTDTVSFYHEGNPQSLKDIAAAVYDYSIAKIIHGHHTDNLDESVNPMSAKQKSFAALAEPKDKITFADKIAGAKKEVDEMLGDVAAEAMKAALGKGKQPTMGEATKEIPGGRRHTAGPGGYGRKDDEDAPRVQTQRGRGRPKKNADSETGEVMKPDWSAFGVGKVNLPKHKGAVTKHKMVGEESDPQTWTTIEDVEFIEDLMDRAFEAGSNSLGNTLQGVLEVIKYNQDDEEPVNEKAVSKKQQKFMGMVHAAQKGEKPASKEVAKVAREMPKKEAEKFAKTKHKGLPEKVKEEDTDTRDTRAEKAGKKVTKDIEYDERVKDGDHGKKRGPQDAKAEKAGKKVAKDIEHDEKVDETTTSGSVATAPAAGGSKTKGGVTFGKGIYDSYNREVESMISESMNVSVNLNSEPGGGANKSITVTATDQDADTLASLLKMAGLGSGAEGHSAGCAECGQEPCDCEHTMEEAYGDTDATKNDPDYPTNQEYSSDALQYSGGLNKPKTDVAGDGQSTGPVTAVSTVDKEDEQDELDRMMEAAGIKKAKPDYIDIDKDGDKSEPMKKAAKDAEEKVDESIFSSTRNLWKTYKA